MELRTEAADIKTRVCEGFYLILELMLPDYLAFKDGSVLIPIKQSEGFLELINLVVRELFHYLVSHFL